MELLEIKSVDIPVAASWSIHTPVDKRGLKVLHHPEDVSGT
tara:strand:- start:1439 stop:1561 length:123 start_codon:yes stop_codon:yes gene_type:complete